ncbi:MAG: large subunit ribosomal protein L21e [Thermoplasmata archaeon]|jgi:large subunit ribosomal protein L21e|nr:large subunit ribosomal protein L21e [Thermoplasmata archaeon]
MVVRSKGFRSKTRHKLAKHPRARGKPPVTHSLRDYPPGTKVAITINASVQRGMPHPRFQGLTGNVLERRGDAFVIAVRAGHKVKTIIARPEHLRLITPAPTQE